MALYKLKVLSFFLYNRKQRTPFFFKYESHEITILLHCRLENSKSTSSCCILFFSLDQFDDWCGELVILWKTENGLNFGVALP